MQKSFIIHNLSFFSFVIIIDSISFFGDRSKAGKSVVKWLLGSWQLPHNPQKTGNHIICV